MIYNLIYKISGGNQNKKINEAVRRNFEKPQKDIVLN